MAMGSITDDSRTLGWTGCEESTGGYRKCKGSAAILIFQMLMGVSRELRFESSRRRDGGAADH